MKKFIYISILLLALLLRFIKLGQEPVSLDWDEASLGYTAYTLLTNGTDEYGNTWPLSVRSFNDYKPPAYAYLAILPVAIFGLNEFSTRAPSAFLGSLTVIGVFLLTKEFFKKQSGFTNNQTQYIALLAMFVFAISPWHLQFSRAAFEGNIAVFFLTFGMYFLLRWLNPSKSYNAYVCAIFLVGTLYAYHASRLVVPLLLFGIALRYRKFFLLHIKTTALSTLLAMLLCIPLLVVIARGTASSRFLSVSIFGQENTSQQALVYNHEDRSQGKNLLALTHNVRVEVFKDFIQGYVNHYSISSMFVTGDVVERHHAPNVGLFYLIELPLMIIGLLYLIKNKFNYKFIFFYWVIIAPIPAAISTGTPHAIRSILFLPIPQIAIAVGIFKLVQTDSNISAYKIIKPLVISTIIVAYSFNFAYYLNQYYSHQSVEYAKHWQYGYKELVTYINQNQNIYNKIVITTAYDQPYIYFLFYNKHNIGLQINDGSFNQKYNQIEFRRIDWSNDKNLKNTLLVGGPLEIPENETGTLNTIKFPDGADAFRIIRSQK
ncbi:MAG: glycosyltransferase family 39 protein [bacterium]|nr:glycosyltransferase family 39 protein [bacterium]